MQSSIHLNLGDHYILAAEDSPVQAKRLKHFLDTNDINCEICSNGADALQAAKARKPVLIISDIIMPGMDGYEFCTKIKSDPVLNDIPVILLTSLSDPLDIIKGLQAGADNFITKPYDEQYLLSRIYYLLANNQMRRIGSGDMVIEIMFQGTKYQINSDKKQILDLLLSVYEAAIHRNEDLIEAQLQLQRSNENLISANQELEAFARTVSHDLRSPLSGVVGFATLLLSDSKNMDDVAKNYIQWILESGYKMAQLIDDLLQYSRSGLADITLESVDLSKMASEIVADLKMRNPERIVNVNVQEDIVVNADQKLIQVVLNNLLGNAWKYSGKVENAEISFGKVELEGITTLFIADNGAGFDMEKAEKLFSPFIRLHSNNEFQGTGVGLSTVKRIIEKHNGSIWAESEKGKGAIFYFTINT